VGEWFAGGGAAGSAVRRRVCKEVKKDYCEDAPHRMAILQAIKFGGLLKQNGKSFDFPLGGQHDRGASGIQMGCFHAHIQLRLLSHPVPSQYFRFIVSCYTFVF
jgi:hypothetical protein